MGRGRRMAEAAAALAGYALAVVWLTWPLAAHVATHLPHTKFICDIDLRQMIWALAWQSHALATAPRRFFDANIYHPTPHALLYADAGVGALPYFWPTFRATGNAVLASNLMFLGGLALTASALHLLVVRWTGLRSAGVVAAATLLATPWVLWTWIPAAPNYAVLFLLPAIVLLAAEPEPSRRRAVLLAALLVLHGAANPYYAASALATVGAIAGARLVSHGSRRSAALLLVAVACAALLLAVVYGPWAWLRVHDPGLAERVTWKLDRALPRLVPMAIPSGLLADARKPTAVPWPALAVVGAGLAAWLAPGGGSDGSERIAWRHGLAWLAVGLALSLMPTIRIVGRTIELPIVGLVDRLPLVATLREPYRIGVGALVGLAILAGAAFACIVRRLGRSSIVDAVLTAVVVVATFACTRLEDGRMPWGEPYPLAAVDVPTAIVAMLRRPGGAVLEVPLDGPLVERVTNAHAMLQSIEHWRPLVNGYGGFYPADFREHMQLAAKLPDAAALRALRHATGLEYVVVHRGAMPTPSLARWEQLARRRAGEGLRFVMRQHDDLLFVVSDDADATPERDRAP